MLEHTDYVQTTEFMPPAEDLVMQGVASNGARFYIFDTDCKGWPHSPEEKEEKDRRILEIYARSEAKKRLRALRLAEQAADALG